MNLYPTAPALLLTDAYKLEHPHMFPENMTLAFNNFTPRKSRMPDVNYVVTAGIVPFLKYALPNIFREFDALKYAGEHIRDWVQKTYAYRGFSVNSKHFEEMLNSEAYKSLEIRCLEEGTFCPIGVPFLTYHNTDPRAYFLPSYLETIISLCLWKPITSATIASQYKLEAVRAHMKTHGSTFDEAWEATMWQYHDFSMRGMDSLDAASLSGVAHLFFFNGSDTLPAYYAAQEWYKATIKEGGDFPAVVNVPATEHAVMCAGGKETELDTFRRLLDLYPEGIVSVVSDTWDLWHVITDTLVRLKSEILSRNGKLVIRPDSGNPVDIICGDNYWKDSVKTLGKEVLNKPESKGVIELLWDIFGGTVNEAGYKVLDPHIGCIYGDSITLERQKEINERLEAKGFASSNVVLGIGSYTYNYNTRDTFGMAVKATYVETTDHIADEVWETRGREIFKDPVTDDGTKKSAVGLLAVNQTEQGLVLKQRCTWDDVNSSSNMLKLSYSNGSITNFVEETTFSKIRQNVKEACRAIIAAEQNQLIAK